MTITNHPLSTLDEVFDFIDPLHPTWASKKYPDLITSSGWIFRGQPDEKMGLVPSAFRSGKLEDFVFWASSHVLNNANTHVVAELKVLREFIMTADAVGLQTPVTLDVLRRIVSMISQIDANIASGNPLIDDIYDANILEALALAQHHGIPTRLLDWTLDIHHALFFAAHTIVSLPNPPAYFAIWAINHEMLDLDYYGKSNVQVLFTRRSNDDYIEHQGGLFTYVRDSNERFSSLGTWEPHDEAIQREPKYDPAFFHKCMIPSHLAKDIIRRLYAMGFSLVKLMPTLDKAAESIKLFRIIHH